MKPFFLSFSLLFVSLLSLIFLFPSFFPFISLSNVFLFYCLLSSHHSISLSLYFYFAFLLFSFFSSLSAHFLFLIILNRNVKKWGKLPPTFLYYHMSSPCISYFLLYFTFPFITSFNTWLNVIYLFQVHHMSHAMCHSLRVPSGIHMIMPCVTRHMMPRKT